MKRLSREAWLAIGLMLVLVFITVVAAVQRTRQEATIPFASFSTAPSGTRALWLWLSELGYTVSDEVYETFQIPDDAAVALVLQPIVTITPEEWQQVDAWVEGGGTLILAGDNWPAAIATDHYGFTMRNVIADSAYLTAQTPLLTSPPLTGSVTVNPRAYFHPADTDFIVHLALSSQPVMLSFTQGRGRVVLVAAPFPFSNAGLKESGNPVLVLNAIAAAGRPGTIWFDEYHHGIRSRQAELAGPGDWLRHTPAGRSLLYVAGVVFLALVWRGRRFGRPVPLPRTVSRRTPMEYVTAIANLNRRAGNRRTMLQNYRRHLKRDLGKRYRLDPGLPDQEFVARLAVYRPGLDEDALLRLLTQLSESRGGEGELIQLAASVATWLGD